MGACSGSETFPWASPCVTCAIRVTAALFGGMAEPVASGSDSGEAGQGWGQLRDSLGCSRRKWLGASAVAMCTLKGSAQRLLLGSLLGESRWDFSLCPIPSPFPLQLPGALWAAAKARALQHPSSPFDAQCSHFGAQHPGFGARHPSPSAQRCRCWRDWAASPCLSNPRAGQALGAVRERMDQVH